MLNNHVMLLESAVLRNDHLPHNHNKTVAISILIGSVTLCTREHILPGTGHAPLIVGSSTAASHSLLLKVWSVDQQQKHYLGAC